MKKFKIGISASIIAILLLTNIFAAGESLDIEKVASLSIINSMAIKLKADAYETADENLYNATNSTRGISQAARYPMSENTALSVIKALQVTPRYVEYQRDAALIQLEAIENAVRLQAYEQYINLLKIDFNVNIQEQLVKSLDRSFKLAEKKYKLGKISKNDYRTAELNLKKAILEQQKNQRTKQSLTIRINQAISSPINTKYDKLISDNIVPEPKLKDVQSYIDSALNNRGEVLNTNKYLSVLEKDYEISKAGHPFDSDIYHKEYKYKIDEASNNVEIQKLNVQLEIMSAYKELEKRDMSLKTADKNLEIAKVDNQKISNMYKQGKISELDYMNANIQYSQAQTLQHNAQLDLWLYQKKIDCASVVGPGIVNK
jgi:outer membrane protein TolC